MSEQDQKAHRLYGKIPAKNLVAVQKDRKYFDSGEYMMAKAGIHTGQAIGVGSPGLESVHHETFWDDGHTLGGPTSSDKHARPLQSHTGSDSNQLNSTALYAHGAGVGISPQPTGETKEMPGVGFGQTRRGSGSHTMSYLGTPHEGTLPSCSSK